MQIAPYGSWVSPVSLDMACGAAVVFSGGFADGDDLYWYERRPTEQGRTSLWRRRGDVTREITPGLNVGSRVYEYGGGAAAARCGLVVVNDLVSGRVHVVGDDAAPRPITPAGPWRYGGFSVIPCSRLVACVREDHSVAGAEPVDALVVLDLDGDNPDGGRVVAIGADFYGAPDVFPDGSIVWTEWDHPNMPWDVTRLCLGRWDVPGAQTRLIAGDGRSSVACSSRVRNRTRSSTLNRSWLTSRLATAHSIVSPQFGPDGSVYYLCDESGFWNFRRWKDGVTTVLHDAPYDFCEPPWALDPAPYTVFDDGSIGCTWIEDGWTRLGRLTTRGELVPLAPALPEAEAGRETRPRSDEPASHGAEHGDTYAFAAVTAGDTGVVWLGFPDRPSAIYALTWASGEMTELARSSPAVFDPAAIALPHEVTWESADGPVHAWFYAPTSPAFSAPTGELPPVIVQSHGGPTGFTPPAFSLRTQFWTSRGIGVLDVNYAGSSGYGRAYRERLRGQWGIADVRDCSEAALELARRGLADPHRLAIMGGSAGGFTTLAALCFTDTFAAGISSAGIGDLEALARDTHKFEAHYVDGLVAPYPAGRALYVERSPIHHVDRFSAPMLLLQGLDDVIVAPSQAETMAAALVAKGIPVRLVFYEGEGHGFRRAETLRDRERQVLAFLADVFGFTPAP